METQEKGGVTPPPLKSVDTHTHIKNLCCFNVDAMTVPEALATTILIL